VVDSERSATSAPSGRSDRVLELLEDGPDEVILGELADAVFRAEDAIESREEVHEDLFVRVLPSLEERGELRFDVERGVVIHEPDDSDTPPA
jgi:hypothetical protein